MVGGWSRSGNIAQLSWGLSLATTAITTTKTKTTETATTTTAMAETKNKIIKLFFSHD